MVSARGFSLVELLIVIAVIGVLAGALVIIIDVPGQLRKARDSERKADLAAIQSAFELFRADVRSYPTALQYSAADCNQPLINNSITYIQSMPCDPLTGNRYTYILTGSPPQTYQLQATLENPASTYTVTNP